MEGSQNGGIESSPSSIGDPPPAATASLMFRCPPRSLATFSLLSKGTPAVPVSVSPRIANRALSSVRVSPVISAALSFSSSKKMSTYVTEQHGSLYSDNYRLFFKKADDGTPVSPMHDIPL